MTDHYFEVTLISPCPDNTVFAEIINRLHGIYKEEQSSPIGVNFPYWQDHIKESGTTLGKTIRLFGDNYDLMVFSRNPLFNELSERDDVIVSEIKATPESAMYVQTRRDRSIERYKRNNWPIKRHLPYLKYKSQTNKNQFSLFVGMQPSEESNQGRFSTYGFSKNGSTVPYF